MTNDFFAPLIAQIERINAVSLSGEVSSVAAGGVAVSGLSDIAAIGDVVELPNGLAGEIVRFDGESATIMADGPLSGIRLGMKAHYLGSRSIFPSASWIGRVIDADGCPLDGRPLEPGVERRSPVSTPPQATARKSLGHRLRTGQAVFDTLLPIVRGQRVGLFAGSGVGKSRLLAALAQGIEADVVVIGLIGERGREVRDFVTHTLGPEGMKRSVVVAATSDQPALTRMRAAHTMMTAAEYFRDQGKQVLLLADSITRFAEAHREVAAVRGEMPAIGGFPASLTQEIMSLCERAGPGLDGQGDITAIMSVLVAGSDMEGPVADILRGVLDGHVVLDREIAERGRFPAINLLRSVSRSLPHAADERENEMIARARRALGAYDKIELMLQAGLYVSGNDADADEAVELFPKLDDFLAMGSPDVRSSFDALDTILTKRIQTQAA